MSSQPRRLTKREAERLLRDVEAAGDDVEAVRRAVGEAVAVVLGAFGWEQLVVGASIEQLWDLAAELNERRTL